VLGQLIFFGAGFQDFPALWTTVENAAKYKKFIRQLMGYVSSSLNIGDPFSSRNDPTGGGN
jgi:hypothetical protein